MMGQPTASALKRPKQPRRQTGGFAFVAVLLVMLVLAILITGILTLAVSTRNLSSSRHEYTEALYVAEAGINKVVATWRKNGLPDLYNPVAVDGTITSQGKTGAFHVIYDFWHPYPGATREDVVVLTSQGTINTALSDKTIYNITRTIQVNFDTNGDWGWSHVYYSDDLDVAYQVPPYANINGNSGDVEPGNYLDEHGPGMGSVLPTPKWNEWEATAAAYDTLPYSNALMRSKEDATEARHVYWQGNSTTAHTGAGHTHYNYFTPDPYFSGLSYPAAYGCNDFTVTFNKHDGVDYSGVYYVHGNVIVKNGVTITGTIIATGDVSLQGQAITIVPLIKNEMDCEARTVYPAIIGGRDVLITDQGVDFHTLGIIWAGHSFESKASNQSGCIVSPHITLGGNFNVTYGFDTSNPDCPRYEPGSSPPPMFNEPDLGAMQAVPHTWREL